MKFHPLSSRSLELFQTAQISSLSPSKIPVRDSFGERPAQLGEP
jgi:hypothetical protein